MLVPFLVSLSIASLLTAVFALRFPDWYGSKFLIGYFLFFLGCEFIAEYFFMPSEAFGIELAVVCFFITAVVIGVTRFMLTLEHAEDTPSLDADSEDSSSGDSEDPPVNTGARSGA